MMPLQWIGDATFARSFVRSLLMQSVSMYFQPPHHSRMLVQVRKSVVHPLVGNTSGDVSQPMSLHYVFAKSFTTRRPEKVTVVHAFELYVEFLLNLRRSVCVGFTFLHYFMMMMHRN